MSGMRNDLRLDRLPVESTIEVRSELEEWIVREAYACTEPHAGADAYHWTEYRLQERESNATAWLSVEFDDGEWESALFTRQVGLDEVGYRRGEEFPDEFVVDGQTFAMDESGKLEATRVGSTTSYRGQYADYVHRDGRVLSIEAYPDPTNSPRETDVEIWLGRIVEPRSLEINVGDPAKAPHLTPAPLPNAEQEQPSRPASTKAPARIGESLRPVERRFGVLTDSAQRTARMVMVAGAVAVVLIILVVLVLL